MSSKKFGSYVSTDSILGYAIYAVNVSQVGTAAPSATVFINGFGATTFTWARSALGIYTLTANTAVFIANKTFTNISPPSLDLVTYKAVITSTTVITITTGVTAVVATVLTAVATDAILNNTLIEIKVYD